MASNNQVTPDSAAAYHREMTLKIFEAMPVDVRVLFDGDVEFKCHKAILISWSKYFRTALVGDSKEPRGQVIQLGKTVTVGAFSVLHHYMYTEQLRLTHGNFLSIVTSAWHLKMDEVLKITFGYLQAEYIKMEPKLIFQITETFSPTSYKELRDFRFLTLTHMALNIKLYCATNAPAASNKLFREFSFELWSNLLSMSELNIDENSVFTFVIKWLNHDSNSRMQHADVLLSQVRLGLVETKHLLPALKPKFVPNIPVTHQVILDIIDARCNGSKMDKLMKEIQKEHFQIRKSQKEAGRGAQSPACKSIAPEKAAKKDSCNIQ